MLIKTVAELRADCAHRWADLTNADCARRASHGVKPFAWAVQPPSRAHHTTSAKPHLIACTAPVHAGARS